MGGFAAGKEIDRERERERKGEREKERDWATDFPVLTCDAWIPRMTAIHLYAAAAFRSRHWNWRAHHSSPARKHERHRERGMLLVRPVTMTKRDPNPNESAVPVARADLLAAD